MSVPALILSGYLAGIQLHGGNPVEVLEMQSRAAVSTSRFELHAAQTLDVAESGDALRDIEAGGHVTFGPVRVLGSAHRLDMAPDGQGVAAFAGAAVRHARDELVVGVGTVSTEDTSRELALRISREKLTSRIDAGATLIVTDGGVSAGGTLSVQATRRASLTVDGLAGARSHALLSNGQLLESLSGTQHERVVIVANVDLGPVGTLSAGVQVRRDTTPDDRDQLVTAVIAGTASTF